MGQNTVLLLVGIGNPEAKYDDTRHNIGFSALDHFVAKYSELGNWVGKSDLSCLLASGRIGDCQIIAIKPTTYVNLSGQSVRAVMNYYKIQSQHIVVIHDDLDINFGLIRTRIGGKDGGHKGIRSISEAIGEDYGRLRIGIGPKNPKIDASDFVLQKFITKEAKQMNNLQRECTAIISEFIYNKTLLNETRSFLV